ncbi:cytochrome c class II [Sulfuricella denitrificans skB26]|uniref:Cytochrome c class II n=1 Tax=Sulfuricella denitrificans (strain DSM 22764 / NBRC 105220 / skB26) TaxID=1163617 RepID=S6AC50_SULDS|nr:cytochrome c [Sulfuricella denitrificans]BAN35268.1 cytochrome c class II [Sulfuricella denitrificans skB26]
MKNTHNLILNFLASSSLLFAASGVQAAEPLALQNVMKDLGKNMQVITDGISRGDWELVEKTAPLIADHPQPPMSEKMRIMGFMGTNMGKFKTYDGETHEQAQAVGKAAKAKDGQGVILAFQKLQTSCYNCHSEFRKPFVEHFYGKKDAAQ